MCRRMDTKEFLIFAFMAARFSATGVSPSPSYLSFCPQLSNNPCTLGRFNFHAFLMFPKEFWNEDPSSLDCKHAGFTSAHLYQLRLSNPPGGQPLHLSFVVHGETDSHMYRWLVKAWLPACRKLMLQLQKVAHKCLSSKPSLRGAIRGSSFEGQYL